MPKRKRISFDPDDPRVIDIINDIAKEYDIPPGDLLNLALYLFLVGHAKGDHDEHYERRVFSRLLRYGNRLDLDELARDVRGRFGLD